MSYELESPSIDLRKIAPRKLAEVNKEWWLLLGLLLIAAVLNYFAALNQMLLGLYTVPTLFSAYLFGRRHAILTAFASVFTAIVVFLMHGFLTTEGWRWVSENRWYEIAVWGGILVVTAYAMGTIFREVREVYRTLHLVLQYQMKNGVHVENSVFRITEFARGIAETMGLSQEQIDDLRRAAALIEISRHVDPEILKKVARIAERTHSQEDHASAKESGKAADPIPRVARMIELCNETLKPSASSDPTLIQSAAILRLASEYADLTSDSANRRALSPVVARNLITRSPTAKTDAQVLDGFLNAFQRGRMETTPIILIQKLRRFSRVPMVIPVEIATDKRTFHARTEMLGGGGMCIVTPERLQTSQDVRVSFDLPRLGNLLIRGVVVWARPAEDRIGIEFEAGKEQRSVHEWISNLFRDLLSQSSPGANGTAVAVGGPTGKQATASAATPKAETKPASNTIDPSPAKTGATTT
jgi:Tfp pilus assembly protein PilZ